MSGRGFIRLIGCFLLLSLVLSGSGCAGAKPKIEGRTGFDGGIWSGDFSEAYSTEQSSLSLTPAWGMGFFLGFYPTNLFFIDWAPSYLAPGKLRHVASDNTSSYYYSLLNVEAGFSLWKLSPVLPFEVFAGVENGNFGFVSGPQLRSSGTVLKLGLDFVPFQSGHTFGGLRAEYRKSFMSLNDMSPTSGFSTAQHSYYVGLLLMFAD